MKLTSSLNTAAKKFTLRSVFVLSMIASAFAYKAQGQTPQNTDLVNGSSQEIKDIRARVLNVEKVLDWHTLTSDTNKTLGTEGGNSPDDEKPLEMKVKFTIDSLHKRMRELTSEETNENKKPHKYNPKQSFDHAILGLRLGEDVEGYIKNNEENGDSIFYEVSKYDFEGWMENIEQIRITNDSSLEKLRDDVNRNPEEYAYTIDKIQYTFEDYLKSKELVTGEALESLKKLYLSDEGYAEYYDSFDNFLRARSLKEASESEIESMTKEFENGGDEGWKEKFLLTKLLSRYEVSPTLQPTKYEYLKERFERYQERRVDFNQEYHLASNLYALLRTGTLDTWKEEKNTGRIGLIEKIIKDINSSRYYSNFQGKNYLDGNFSMYGQEAEWVLLSLVELMKRGYPENTFNRASPEHPYTLDELIEIAEWRFTKPQTEEKEMNSDKEITLEHFREKGACEGSHNLHAIVAGYVYKNDTANINCWLNETAGIIQNVLSDYLNKERKSTSSEKEKEELVHDLSHWLLPFTELTGDFHLDPNTKQTVKEAVETIINLVPQLPHLKLHNMAHTIDTLDKLDAQLYAY